MNAQENDKQPFKARLSQVADAIINLATGQGTGRDASSYMAVAPVSLSRLEAIHLYRGYWLARKLIDIPVQDMLKNGRTFHDMDQTDVERYNRAWEDYNCDRIIANALKWSRVFGGAGIIPVNENVDLAQPFEAKDFANVAGTRFIVRDATKLQPASGHATITDLSNPNYGRPSRFQHHAQTIDVTNVIIVRGDDSPDADDMRTMAEVEPFWGQSRLLYAKEPVLYAHSLYASIATMVVQNNVDILSVPGLYESLAACGTGTGQADYSTAVQSRAALYALHKGQYNVALIDGNESLERIKNDFQSLPQLIHEFLTAISGLGDIPLVRFAGISPGGLNSTGEADLENHYTGIAGQQKSDLNPLYAMLDRFMTLIVFGEIRELKYTINPPHTESRKSKVETDAKQAETFERLHNMRIIPESAILRSVQQSGVVDIADEWIEAVEAEELDGTDTDTDPDVTPDAPDDPEADQDDQDDQDDQEGTGASA